MPSRKKTLDCEAFTAKSMLFAFKHAVEGYGIDDMLGAEVFEYI